MAPKIGEILIESGVVTEIQLSQALEVQKTKKKRLGELLVELGFSTDSDIADALSKKLMIPLVDCTTFKIPDAVRSIVQPALAKDRLVFPIELKDNTLTIAMADPLDYKTIDELSFRTKLKLSPVVSSKRSILQAIEKNYKGVDEKTAFDEINADLVAEKDVEFLEERPQDESTNIESLYSKGKTPTIVKLVAMLIAEAIKLRASDIHIEPREKYIQVRFRIHGELRNIHKYEKNIFDSVVSRIKIISNLDITNRRLPQDGSTRVFFQNKEVDLRVSTLPSIYGEKIVLRLLDATTNLVPMDDLLMPAAMKNSLVDAIKKPQGMVIVTGPTGSGKTTTLYACLTFLKSETRNIVTIEDPVEYKLEGITQVSVNEPIGLTFASVLRSVLRQDPDVVLVGEIRDLETAEIAVKASLTGHMVLSTLHTNNTIATITRLIDLGIPGYLLGSAVSGILAQRLVRRICNNCKVKYEVPESLYSIEGLPSLTKCYFGTGCDQCGNTGYSGRLAVYEYLPLTFRMKQLISSGADEIAMLKAAKEEGVTFLFEDAWNKVRSGVTSIEEVMSKVPMDYRIKS